MIGPIMELERNSLYDFVVVYAVAGSPLNLTGLIDDADITLSDGPEVIWTSDMAGSISATLVEGRFDILIPESAVDDFTFSQAKYRFRIKWVDKGWQSLVDGKVVFSD